MCCCSFHMLPLHSLVVLLLLTLAVAADDMGTDQPFSTGLRDSPVAETCPTISDYDLQPCEKCTARNFEPGAPLCAFCYHSHRFPSAPLAVTALLCMREMAHAYVLTLIASTVGCGWAPDDQFTATPGR